ncbi:MAG TPA: hypothetical protein VGL77_21010 [Armatimonadota bacterium]|jgi:hypothetical protein
MKLKLRFGAGTIVALVLALVFVGYTFVQGRRKAVTAPVIERHVIGDEAEGIAPVPEYLLRHQQELTLSTAQVTRVRRVADAYRRDIAPVQQQLTIATKKYQQYVERAQGATRPTIQELNAQSATYQRLSRVKTTTRHAYWQQARALLTPAQRQRVDALCKQARLQDLQ